MKRIPKPALAALGLLAALAPSAHAQTLFSDDFEGYTADTNLNTSGPWATVQLGGNPVTVRDEVTATPFGTPNQYLDHNDNSGGSIRIQTSNRTDLSGVVTTLAFDFQEPAAGGADQFLFGYTVTNGDLTSTGARIMPRLDNGVIVGLSSAATNTYSLDTPYRLYVVFNDSASSIDYLGGSLAAETADLWIQSGTAAPVFVGTRAGQQPQTASYRIGFRGYGGNQQQVLLDNVTVHQGVAVPGATPTLLSTTPADDTNGVTAATDLVATFDMPIFAGTGNITITDGVSPIVLDVATAPEITISGSTLTIDLASDLDVGTAYSVQIDSTAIENVLGEAYDGISNTTDWNFMTSSDATPPVLQTLSPLDDTTGVAVDTNLVATFDEDIAAGTGNIVITNVTESSTFATIAITDGSQVTISGTTLTINPSSDLLEGRTYAVEIDSGAVTDLASNPYGGISGTATWNFDTVADATDPTLVSRSPGNATTRASLSNNLIATFSESIQTGTGNIVIKDLTNATTFATYDVGDPEVSISGSQLIINPPTNLDPNTDYSVQIDATAIDDLSGNSFAGISDDTTWGFMTTLLLSRDYIIGERQAGAPASDYYPGGGSNVVGTGGPGGGIDHKNVVFGMTLPTLPAGTTAGSVDFEFEITAARDTTGAANLPELHVYLLDTADPDATGDTFFFEGPSDPSTDVELVTTTSVTVTGTGENSFADDSEDRVVTLTGDALALIRSFYGGDHIPDQPEAFFRFNLGEDTLINTYRRYRIDTSSAEADLQVTAVSTSPPTLTSTVPADDSTGVAEAGNLTATFDLPIQAGSGDITIKNLTDATTFATIPVGDAQVTISGNDLIIDPATDLDPAKDYAVQIAAGAVESAASIAFAGVLNDTTWNFSTGTTVVAALDSTDNIVGRAVVGTSLGYFPSNAGGGQIGIGGSAATRIDRNVVLGFTLPTLPVGASPSAANLDFQITRSQDNGDEPTLDAYVLNTADPDSSGITFFYHGPSDPNTDVEYVGSTNLNEPNGSNTVWDPHVDTSLMLPGDALTLLQGLYGGDHIPDQAEVFIRFNLGTFYTGTGAGGLTGVPFNRYFVDTGSTESSLSITYTGGSTSPYDTWATSNGLSGPDAATTADPENSGAGDGLENLLEYAFGTNPNVADNAELSVSDGTTFAAGTPAVEQTFSPLSITLRYVRLKDHVAAGLTYTPQFAADGMTFVPDPDNPVPTVVSDAGGDYEVVEVPFLLFDGDGMKADAMLGQVEVTLTP